MRRPIEVSSDFGVNSTAYYAWRLAFSISWPWVFYYDRREVERDALLEVRVTPRASRDEILGWREGILHVRLRAPPVEGRANESLRRLLSERLGVPANAIEVISGLTARRKRVRIRGKTRVEVDEALGAPR